MVKHLKIKDQHRSRKPSAVAYWKKHVFMLKFMHVILLEIIVVVVLEICIHLRKLEKTLHGC